MKRRNIILIAFVLIYIIVSIVCGFLKSDRKTVYLGSYTKVYIDDGIKINSKGETISNKKIKYYFNSTSKSGYLKSVGEVNNPEFHLEVRNEEGKIIDFLDDIIAYTTNVDIEIEKPSTMSLSQEDKDLITNFLSNNGYDTNIKYSSKSKFDLDKDGKEEEIYSINIGEQYSSLLLLRSGDSISLIDSVIYNSEDEEEINKNILLYIYADFDSDGVYEFVIKENNGDNKPTYYNVYSYSEGIATIIEEE